MRARFAARAPRLYASRHVVRAVMRVVVLPVVGSLVALSIAFPDVLPDWHPDLGLHVPEIHLPGVVDVAFEVLTKGVPLALALGYTIRELRKHRESPGGDAPDEPQAPR